MGKYVNMERIMNVRRFSKMGFDSIWFADDQHKSNFIELMTRFNAWKNPEYASGCYIVAHPEIYMKVASKVKGSPWDWYWGKWTGVDDDDPNGKLEESEIVGWLSSAYRALVRAGVEMYTSSSRYFDFSALFGNAGDEVYRVFIQALEIRRDRFIIDLWYDVDDQGGTPEDE